MSQRSDLIAASLIFGAALVLSTMQVQKVLLRIKTDDQTIRVPGAAKRRIASDVAVFRASLTAHASESSQGHQTLAAAVLRLRRVIAQRPVLGAEQLTVGATAIHEICSSERCRESGTLDRYEMTLPLELRSRDLDAIARLTTDAASLVQQAELSGPGLKLEIRELAYHATRLEELKFEVLAEATRNARERANQLAGAAGVRLGAVLSASLGDVEIRVPDQPGQRYADDVASREKDVVANVTVTYALR